MNEQEIEDKINYLDHKLDALEELLGAIKRQLDNLEAKLSQELFEDAPNDFPEKDMFYMG